MKKIVSILISAILLFACGCGAKQHTSVARLSGFENIGADSADLYLRKFLNVSEENPNGNLGRREAFTESEKQCALGIKAFIDGIEADGEKAYGCNVQTFSYTDSAGVEKTSQNVIATKRSKAADAKQVILATYYDNYVSSVLETEITYSVGAMENGTGCALLYSLLDYYKDIELPFDLVFAFFGASNNYNAGSEHFVKEMTPVQKKNTLLMLSVHRFGGTNLYLYCDETPSTHQELFMSVAGKESVKLDETPKYLPVIAGYEYYRVPYGSWPLMGVHSPFHSEHIKIANIYSGDYSFFYLSDDEAKGKANRSGTASDTYQNLVKDYPGYSAQIISAAKLIARTLSDGDFIETLGGENTSYGYDWMIKPLYANIALLALIILLVGVLFLVVRHLEKKYPPKKIQYKIAVFGADYEEKKEDQVIIDVKPKTPPDPFS